MKNILIIDDSFACRQVLKISLKQIQQYRIEMASNGQEALDIINNYESEFDLIFVDIKMPVMDGFEFAKKYNGKGKLIAYTALHPSYLKSKERQNFDFLLIKPISKKEIEEIIKTLN